MPSDRTPYAFPAFASVEDERRHRKQRLAAALRLFGRFGFDEGVDGHITARDPELLDHVWVHPLGTSFREVRVKDLLLVDAGGEVVEGEGPLNQAAFAIHSQLHAARPDVVAVAHAHSVHGTAWSSLRRRLDPITQDACVFHGDHALDDGTRIAHALGANKAVILANHGLLTVGHTVDAAAWWFITMERTCQAQLAAVAAGQTVLIDPDVAERTARLAGPPMAGWRAFQPLYDVIVRQQPDLLDED